MRLHFIAPLVVAMAVLAVNCSDSDAGEGSGGAAGAGGSDAAVDADASLDATACSDCPAGCPDSLPIEGSACAAALVCKYGACPIIPLVASCVDGAWKFGFAPCTGACPPHIPHAGSNGGEAGSVCTYVDPCCGGTTTWIQSGQWYPMSPRCALPPPEFPVGLPNATTPSCGECSDPTAKKDYLLCGSGAGYLHTLRCEGGAWQDWVIQDFPCGDL